LLPNSAEAALDSVEAFIRNTNKSVIIVDSIPSLLSKGEMEESVDERNYNPVSLMLSKLAKKVPQLCRKHDSILIYINQLRPSMEEYGPNIRTPGPWAIKYTTHIRIEMKRKQAIKEKEEIIGHQVQMQAIKNRFARPFQKAYSNFIYGVGFHQGFDLIEMVQMLGMSDLIDQGGAWYTFYTGEKIQGLCNAADFIMKNQEMQNHIRGKLIEACRS
jgi:recombination protein RecA